MTSYVPQAQAALQDMCSGAPDKHSFGIQCKSADTNVVKQKPKAKAL